MTTTGRSVPTARTTAFDRLSATVLAAEQLAGEAHRRPAGPARRRPAVRRRVDEARAAAWPTAS